MTEQQMQAEIARLKAENAKLQQAKVQRLSLKRTEKGGLSVYGLGRFPVTLYREQWIALMGMVDTILAEAHKLPTKAEKAEQAETKQASGF